MYKCIKEVFNKKFGAWDISISDEDLFVGKKKVVPAKEWYLRWVIQENEKGVFVEYYGVHNKRGHIHGRIYEGGREESLEVLKEYIAYAPNVPGDRERSTKDFEAYNRCLMEELKDKGLM